MGPLEFAALEAEVTARPALSWRRRFGREIAHAYDSEAALLPVCGTNLPEPGRCAVDTSDRRCRRCLAVLGSRRTRQEVEA